MAENETIGNLTIGMRGKVRGPKGNYWHGYVRDVDLSGLHVLWAHNNYRMTDRWYAVADVRFEEEADDGLEHCRRGNEGRQACATGQRKRAQVSGAQ